MRCFNCKHWNGDKEKIRSDVKEYGDVVLDPVKGWAGSGDCEVSTTESGRVSIPLQRELEAWQELAKYFARRLARRDWHRLNSMEILLVEQLEIFGYLEKASGGFVGKQISI